jgi:hypothetical protein
MFPGWFAARSRRPWEVLAVPASPGLEIHRSCPWALTSYLLISLLDSVYATDPITAASKDSCLKGPFCRENCTYQSVGLALLIRLSLRLPQGSSAAFFPSSPPSNGLTIFRICPKYRDFYFKWPSLCCSQHTCSLKYLFHLTTAIGQDRAGLVFGPSI